MALPVSSRPPPVGTRQRVAPHEADVAAAQQGVREAAEGKLITVTEADLKHWAETGEWPASSS